MKLLPYLKNRMRRMWRKTFYEEKVFQIETIPLVTPKSVYRDSTYVIDADDWCDEDGEIYYLREDVRLKTHEYTLRKLDQRYPEYEPKFYKLITFGELTVHDKRGILNFADFIRHPKLISALDKILNTPFLVMLYDLDLEKQAYLGWYKQRISRLKNVAPEWSGKPHADAVLKELERIGAELGTFCRHAMEYNTTIVIPFLREAVCFMHRQDTFQANESIHSAKIAYKKTQKKVAQINRTLRNVRNIVDNAGLFVGENLQRASEQIALIKLPLFKT